MRSAERCKSRERETAAGGSRRSVGALLAALAFLLAPPAEAGGGSGDDSRAAIRAQEAFERGAAHYARGRYQEAIDEFRRGQHLYPAAIFVYNMAMSHMRLGHTREAARHARRALQADERGLGPETSQKARGLIAGSHVAGRSERHAERLAEAGGANEASAAGQTRRGRASSGLGVPRAPGAKLGWLGWSGVGGLIAGSAGLATTLLLAVHLEGRWDRLRSLQRGSSRRKFERTRDEIARKQRLGRAFGFAGSALVLTGAGLLIADLVGGASGRRVSLAPDASGTVWVSLKF